jgi:hypothetical protein
LNDYLDAIDWNFVIDNSDINEDCDGLSNKLITGLNLTAPVKSVKNTKKLNEKPWFTRAITVSLKTNYIKMYALIHSHASFPLVLL